MLLKSLNYNKSGVHVPLRSVFLHFNDATIGFLAAKLILSKLGHHFLKPCRMADKELMWFVDIYSNKMF